MGRLKKALAVSAVTATTLAMAGAGILFLAVPSEAGPSTVSVSVNCLNGLANFANPTVVTVHPGDSVAVSGDAVNLCTRAGTALPGGTAWLSDWPGAPTLMDTTDFIGTQPFTWTVRADAPLGNTGVLFAVGAMGDPFNPPSSTYFALDIVAAPAPPPVVTDDDDATDDAGEHASDDATEHPSDDASEHPSDHATEPAVAPTTEPTTEPTGEPTADPTTEPTTEPSSEPQPSDQPSEPASEHHAQPASEHHAEHALAPVAEHASEPTPRPHTQASELKTAHELGVAMHRHHRDHKSS